MNTFILSAGDLNLSSIRELHLNKPTIQLETVCYENIEKAAETVKQLLEHEQPIYGINTGFGVLANKKIPHDQLQQLQHNLIVSHASGVGDFLSDDIVALVLLLKINSLARGFSGVRPEIIDALIALYNHRVYPCIPEKGSVGASGDLAPLAHLACVLIGDGEARYKGKIIPAKKALKKEKLKSLVLHPKEGLALLNGLQVSTAIALHAFFVVEKVFESAIISGSLSVDATSGSIVPFDARIHALREQSGQQYCAERYHELLFDSEISQNHRDCERVQDPYSLRCQPQVMGACLEHIRFTAQTFVNEANAVSDNPLVFSDDKIILSGGNFHGQAIAMAADMLAVAIAEIGALSERRIALLMDKHLSGLPAFLTKESGLNSGFMVAQVTAAALVSENKALAHPVSVDSIPTSANQEDHVSMSCYAARRLLVMADNAAAIIAIELLAACQGLEFHKPYKTSTKLQPVVDEIRNLVPVCESDRVMAGDIALIKEWVLG